MGTHASGSLSPLTIPTKNLQVQVSWIIISLEPESIIPPHGSNLLALSRSVVIDVVNGEEGDFGFPTTGAPWRG